MGGGGHTKARDMYDQYKDIWDGILVFAFVRNPFDRFESAFYHLKKKDINKVVQTEGAVEELMKAEPGLFGPQWEYIFDENNRQLVPFVGKYESLHKDWARICSLLNTKLELPHNNKSKRGTPLSDESKEILKKIYAEDFKRFYPHLL